MPITVKDELPAIAKLRQENVFVMPKSQRKRKRFAQCVWPS